MRTAEERARELFAETENYNHTDESLRAGFMRILKEYAHDQRHACAEAVLGIAGKDVAPHLRIVHEAFANEAHMRSMNTPFPGEGR